MTATARSAPILALVTHVAILAGSGCAGPDVPAPSSSTGELTALLDRAEPRLIPSGPAAEFYQSRSAERASAPALSDPLRRSVVERIRATATATSGAQIVVDPRLDAAMGDLARTLGEGQQRRSAAVEFLLNHYGVVEPMPQLHVLHIDRAAEDEIAGRLASAYSPPSRTDTLLSIGLGVNRATSQMTVILAIQAKYLDLAPVVRSHPADALVRVAGRMLT
ncbi:MAG: hypothetical protein AAGC55_31350, partial [Myxococcota bacterium]